MSKIRKCGKIVIFISMSVTISSCSFFSDDCDSQSLNMLARAYALSFDYSNSTNFTSYVENNSDYFSEKGKVTKCAVDFSEKLSDYGAGRFSSDKSLNDSVSSLEMQYGFTPSSRGNTGGELLLLAQEIQWLSGVFPSVAEGNYYSYNNTGTQMRKFNKNMMNNLSPIYDLMGLREFQKNISKNMQPLNEQVIINLGAMFY